MSNYGPQQHYKIAKCPEDASDAVAIEFQNNAVVEENNFTDLGKQKDSWRAQKIRRKHMQSRLSQTDRIPINAYCYPPDVIIT